LTLSAFIFSTSAAAEECYKPSPNLLSAEDEYYNLDDTVKLSNAQHKQLKAFFRSIKGQWKGELAYRECRGPDRAPRIKTRSATISAKTTLTSPEQVAITAQKSYIENRTKKRESFPLFNVKNIYDVHFPDPNTLVFSEKYRRSNNYATPSQSKTVKPSIAQAKKYKNPVEVRTQSQLARTKTSRFTETIYEVTSNNNTLSLLRSYYANGVYIGEERWLMRAD